MLSPENLPAGSLLADRYRITARLGAGAMGVVYRAERVETGRVVAIKLLLSAERAQVQRFERELAATARLSHPHLVEVLDSGEHHGTPFMVMEVAAGRPLSHLLASRPLPAPRAVGLARQLLAGLHHAHTGGVVHRDVKPENVVLLEGDADFVKLVDFGLARIVRGVAADETLLTARDMVMGTPSYMPPEQVQGQAIDRRADVYAVGVVLYQLLTGRKPFEHDEPLEVLKMQIHSPPPPPRSLPGVAALSAALEAAVLRALEKQPARRFGTAQEFAAALAATPEGRASVVPRVDELAAERVAAVAGEVPEAPPKEPPTATATATVAPSSAARPRASALLLVIALGVPALVLAAVYARCAS
jgi:serine/threonine-protein kinase